MTDYEYADTIQMGWYTAVMGTDNKMTPIDGNAADVMKKLGYEFLCFHENANGDKVQIWRRRKGKNNG